MDVEETKAGQTPQTPTGQIPPVTESPQEVSSKTEIVEKSPSKFNLSKRTLLLIGGGLLLLLIIILAVSFSKKSDSVKTPEQVLKEKETKEATEKKNNQTAKNNQGANSPTITSIPIDAQTDWLVIKTQVFTVIVPNQWERSVVPFNGGATINLLPKTYAEMEPLLVIDTFTSPGDVEAKVNLYKKFNFTRSNILIQNQPAVKLTGMRDRRTINNKTVMTPTQYRIVYIPRPNSMYAIRMYYSSKEPVKAYDDIFERVTTTFATAF